MRRLALAVTTMVAAGACSASPASGAPASPSPGGAGAQQIKHVVVVIQGNGSFDEYFGTFPGADGLPAGVCVPNPASGGCVKPYHDAADVNAGGPHGATNATADVDGGKMDGFVAQAERGRRACADPTNPACTNGAQDVMGWKDARDIPNYWTYARDFVLQDR